MKRISLILLTAISLFAIETNAQSIESTCTTDSIKLKADNYQYGVLQWEQSFDDINWNKIPNAIDSVYIFKPTTSAYYRVVNKLPYCSPIISSTILVKRIPIANAGSDRIVNDNYVYLTGNIEIGSICTWTILEGTGGIIESPNSSYTKFTGIPASNEENEPTGNYKLLYTLQNDCGSTTDTIDVRFVYNQYYDKIVVVDATDSILSTQAQLDNGEYTIRFSDSTLNIVPQTILIGIIGNGFMRRVETISKDSNIYTMTTSQAKLEDIITKGGLEIGQLYNIESVSQSLKVKGYNKLSKLPTRADLKTNENLKTGSHYFIIDNSIETPLNGVTATKVNARKVSFENQPSAFKDEEFSIQYNFDGTKLYDENGIKATLDGNIIFKPNVVGDVDIDWWGREITNAKIGVDNASLNFKSKLTIEASASGTFEREDIKLGPALHTNLVIVIGGVPTLIQIKTQLNFGVKVIASGDATYVNEFEKTYKVNAGVKYESGMWNNYFDESETSAMHHNLTVKGSVTTSLDLGPIIYFTINGLAGPYVDTKMTSDLTLCASTQNLQDFNWQADAYLGAKLTLGIHSYMFKKELFDFHKTWENRKLFNEKYPYMLEYISGNNQQYTIGTPLEVPLKIRMLSMYGIPANGILTTFEALDNCGNVSQSQVFTDADGYAETIFTPSASGKCRIQVSAKDCDFNQLQNTPFVFLVSEKSVGDDCSTTTLTANLKKQMTN